MISIFPLLLPGLQAKLAHYALLTQRAAVLAALPTVPGGKGRPRQWATLPPPELLRNVVHFAGKATCPKVGRLLFRLWFQKKTELRAAVHRALEAENYPVPPLTDRLEPSPWNVRLGPDDIREQDGQLYFQPSQHLITGAADVSPEEVTLMAHLLGWSVLFPPPGEVPPEASGLETVGAFFDIVQEMERIVRHLATSRLPPALAAQVTAGLMADELADYWPNNDWSGMRTSLHNIRVRLQELLSKPVSPADTPLDLAELNQLLVGFEQQLVGHYVHARHRQLALALLSQADGLRHRQQPDFAPLAALRERTATLRACFDTEWPDDKAATYPPWPRVLELVAQARRYRLLLRLAEHPEQLAALDETSEDYQALEAATPPGVLNALLLRKLYLPA